MGKERPRNGKAKEGTRKGRTKQSKGRRVWTVGTYVFVSVCMSSSSRRRRGNCSEEEEENRGEEEEEEKGGARPCMGEIFNLAAEIRSPFSHQSISENDCVTATADRPVSPSNRSLCEVVLVMHVLRGQRREDGRTGDGRTGGGEDVKT
ncbi:unnamed protein product [Pleuronectes platessa]|uniref:Uncharacterized protein n=1 Tax=Pleuronectes platessa TaxID=8262 RepID=A0A9N7YX95_PLEPL|nr:unnamed protein product [Pleuronectes platessa]